jgi:hypothetical protein
MYASLLQCYGSDSRGCAVIKKKSASIIELTYNPEHMQSACSFTNQNIQVQHLEIQPRSKTLFRY